MECTHGYLPDWFKQDDVFVLLWFPRPAQLDRPPVDQTSLAVSGILKCAWLFS